MISAGIVSSGCCVVGMRRPVQVQTSASNQGKQHRIRSHHPTKWTCASTCTNRGALIARPCRRFFSLVATDTDNVFFRFLFCCVRSKGARSPAGAPSRPSADHHLRRRSPSSTATRTPPCWPRPCVAPSVQSPGVRPTTSITRGNY